MKTTSVVLTITALILLVAIPVFQVSAQTVDPEPLSGIIQTITPITDPATGEVIIRVALRTDEGVQPLMLMLEDAVALGLVTVPTDVPPVVTVAETMIGQTLTLDPALILELGEMVTQPVAVKLGDFLSGILGVDGAALMAFHEQGLGFGEIAQAGFMAMALNGDSSTFAGILDARKSGDYSAIILPDGSTASNWGQLRKAVFADGKNLKNLGAVMSGRVEKENGKQNREDHGNGKKK